MNILFDGKTIDERTLEKDATKNFDLIRKAPSGKGVTWLRPGRSWSFENVVVPCRRTLSMS